MESNRRLFVCNLPYQVLERDIEDQSVVRASS